VADASLNYNQFSADDIKVPPHSTEAEQSVLGGMLLDNQAWDKVADKVAEDDFYRYDHRVIFRAISDLAGRDQPFDVLTLSEALKSRDEINDAGGEIYLFELAKNTPSAANIASYASIVRERSVLRQMISIASDIADSAFKTEGKEANQLLDIAEQKIFKIAEQGKRGSGPLNVKDYLSIAVDRIETLYHNKETITGIATGYDKLDEMTSGLQAADLVIIAGRPSMGKTMLGMNIAEHVAISLGKPALIFSLEMPGDAIVMRMLSSLGRIDQHRIRSGQLEDEDWPRVTSAINMLTEAPIYIDDTPSLSPAEMRARARRLVKDVGEIGVIVVDYMQLMQIPGYGPNNRVAEVSEISRGLKALAKELNVPVIALSQLNRSLEARQDKRPVMSDLRDSGSIEQDADLIGFIYRDQVYNPETPHKGIAEVIIAKHRNGPIGKLHLAFAGQFTRFDNLASQMYDEAGF
jgi:replicative DNA helicase